MRGATPTGRVRYRQNWRGKLILQAEVEGMQTFRRYHGDIGYAELVKGWRDARVADIYYHSFYTELPKVSDIVLNRGWSS